MEKSFNQGTLQFFYQLVVDELNSKLVSNPYEEEFILIGKNTPSIFDYAERIDKLMASAPLTGNEIRELLGFEKSDDPAMNEIYITKNYQTTKGGEG
ncbi:hypothetical protein [Ligilactobacillus agilis]|uniref:hypothetical protein n=1 Tax=Ligilactobacillus agilis TaxID=1601 RepID=UPI001865C520|nr:hypothetical protein [Ligilactobacillus agilis]